MSQSLASGRLINIWHHTHVTEGFSEQWLVAATPDELGLEQGQFRLRGCNAPFVPSEHGLSSDDVRMAILTRMRDRRLRFSCIWRAPNVERVDAVPNMSGIVAGNYGRQTHVQCFEGSERIIADRYLTSVVFWDTRETCETCGFASYVPESEAAKVQRAHDGVEQHMHFQGYILLDSGRSEMTYLFGNKYDSYVWTSHPMRPDTFYCAFGSKFSTPFVCSHELPGCHEPRYPDPTAAALTRYAFAVWAAAVYLSYFHTAAFFGAQLIVFALALGWLCVCCRRQRSARHSGAPIAEGNTSSGAPPKSVLL